MYTLSDVVRFLRIPVWAAFAFRGKGFPDPEWFFQRYWRRWQHSLHEEGEESSILEAEFPRLSFQEFAVLFIKSSGLHLVRERRFHPIVLLRPDRPIKEQSQWRSFWNRSPDEVGTDVAESWDIGSLPESEHDEAQKKAQKLAALYAGRVVVENGLAVRLYPFTREPAEDAPRSVLIDPRKRFGQPTIVGVPTEVIRDRFQGGDSVAGLAKDYGITSEQVEEVIRYESETPCLW